MRMGISRIHQASPYTECCALTYSGLFFAEKRIQGKMENRKDPEEVLAGIASRSTRDATENFTVFQREAFKKMKSITNASDDVCVTILSGTGFKLNDSIEQFYKMA